MIVFTGYMTLCTGQPIAWCITDREDQDVRIVHLFLQLVQPRSPGVEVKVIITDDDKPMFTRSVIMS